YIVNSFAGWIGHWVRVGARSKRHLIQSEVIQIIFPYIHQSFLWMATQNRMILFKPYKISASGNCTDILGCLILQVDLEQFCFTPSSLGCLHQETLSIRIRKDAVWPKVFGIKFEDNFLIYTRFRGAINSIRVFRPEVIKVLAVG